MLKCEGHKMFRGKIVFETGNGKHEYSGVWLYEPDNGYWFLAPTKECPWGTSIDSKWVAEVVDEEDKAMEELGAKIEALKDMVVTAENAEEANKILDSIRQRVG